MPELIALPNSSFPKPGETVVWYSHNRKIEGSLLGYDVDERPIIITQFNVPDSTSSFDIIRTKNPNDRIEPNWSRLPEGGKIVDAEESIAAAIGAKLNEKIPPGPSYLDLITEMYYRGYETYLVGGTVRDFIQGEKSNDIDLVTTMPLKSATPLLKSMFNRISYENKQGFIRIGGTPASGDPFIDVKNFTYSNSGAGSKIFGSEIECDLKTRDFACNAIYYDPINKRFLDPSGQGIQDAKDKKLTIVKDNDFHSASYTGAQILIRLVKFATRGYVCSSDTIITIRDEYVPLLSTMTNAHRMSYVNAQLLSKVASDQKEEAYSSFVSQMKTLGFEKEYEAFFKPFEKLLNL